MLAAFFIFIENSCVALVLAAPEDVKDTAALTGICSGSNVASLDSSAFFLARYATAALASAIVSYKLDIVLMLLSRIIRKSSILTSKEG